MGDLRSGESISGIMVKFSESWEKVKGVFRAWKYVTKGLLKLGIVISLVVGAVVGGGVLSVYFPLFVGVLIEGLPISEVVSGNWFGPPVPDIWMYISYVWWFLMLSVVATGLALLLASEGDGDKEEDFLEEPEAIGECPRCDTEVNGLVEKDFNTALNTAWKCPECGAILSVT